MPIQSRAEYRSYMCADLQAFGLKRWGLIDSLRLPTLHFQRHLRLTEYICNCWHGALWAPVRAFMKWRLREHGIRLGFSITPNIFGPGLCIVHWGTIVVNPDARVGANCRLHPGTCIGEGRGKVPRIGNNAYIGPGAKVFGGVILGDYTQVGANAVVSHSYPDGHVTLIGIPARPSPKTPSSN